VKHLRKLWGLIAIAALVAVLTFSYVKQAGAFTLIELKYLPAIQLVEGQEAVINVTNVTTESVVYNLNIYAGDGALLALKQDVTIAPGQTIILPYVHPAGTTFPLAIRAVIAVNTANAVVSDIGILDPATGELVVIARATDLPTAVETELLPAIQLVANQSAAVNLSNVGTESVEGVLDIYAGDGSVLVSKTVSLAAGQTIILPYKHPAGTFPLAIRAVLTMPNLGFVVSDIATFDVKSGKTIALLPFIE